MTASLHGAAEPRAPAPGLHHAGARLQCWSLGTRGISQALRNAVPRSGRTHGSAPTPRPPQGGSRALTAHSCRMTFQCVGRLSATCAPIHT